MSSQTEPNAEFEHLRETWTRLGDLDPLWAILSDPSKEGGKWDVGQFFRSGEADLEIMLDTLEQVGAPATLGKALDFGCGVGRVTQAMARRFQHSHGVDVAETMIEQARRFNRAPERCTFHHNPRPDLALFPDDTFDFIYSMIVLQHMEPALSKGYVGEILRVLKPGGTAAFQIPAERQPVPVGPGVTRCDGPLPEGARFAEVEVVTPGRRLRRLAAGAEKRITVRVHNRGDATWPAVGTPDGRFWIRVANQWLDESGDLAVRDDGRAGLPFDLRPGESAKVRLTVTAPEPPGQYTLVLDVVQEAVCWFQEREGQATKVPLEVRAAEVGADGPGRQPEKAGTDKPAFEMHSVPREEVESLVASRGGRLLAVLPDDSAGDAWISFLYIATKDAAAAGAQE